METKEITIMALLLALLFLILGGIQHAVNSKTAEKLNARYGTNFDVWDIWFDVHKNYRDVE